MSVHSVGTAGSSVLPPGLPPGTPSSTGWSSKLLESRRKQAAERSIDGIRRVARSVKPTAALVESEVRAL